MRITHIPILLLCSAVFFAACTDSGTPQSTTTATKKDSTKKEPAPAKNDAPAFVTKYHPLSTKDSGWAQYKRYTPAQQAIILKLNRIDAASVRRADTLVIPDSIAADIMAYSPYPASLPFLKDVRKMIFFSYPIQAFAAYENGQLTRWGPTSMGRKTDQTPTGLHYANWKAEDTHSTVNDEWDLKWNVNIMNKDGVGFHQYIMPGYPASHSCLRLQEDDAKALYPWVDQWIQKGTESVAAQGTPVMVFGAYAWGGRRPWKALLDDPKANNISVQDLETLVTPVLDSIKAAQAQRDAVLAAKAK